MQPDNVLQKVAEATHQSLGTSPFEMSNGAVLTVSFGSGVVSCIATRPCLGQIVPRQVPKVVAPGGAFVFAQPGLGW